MDTLALISGGKDSLLSLLRAQQAGHAIVALANLHPPLHSSSSPPATTVHPPQQPPFSISLDATPSDELDSFMYQTIGHTLLPLVSSCIGLPLYRRPIVGSAEDSSLTYTPVASSADETEDLLHLIQDVLRYHPTVKYVVSGAILSTYQRVRIESVCGRLGLTSVASLWQERQERVLEQLGELGVEARIVKVAALGLDESWLWENVADQKVRKKLAGLKDRWGINPAGEGGEYETLCVSAPGWKGQIVVGEEERVVRAEEGGGGAVWLQFKGAKVEPAEGSGAAMWKDVELLEEEFQTILDGLSNVSLRQDLPEQSDYTPLPLTPTLHSAPPTIYISNLSSSAPSLSSQISEIFSCLTAYLSEHNLSLQNLAQLHLSLSTLSNFAPLNALYSTYFPSPLPPTRITISTPLPPGCLLSLSATASLSPNPKSGLHVQSRSYWAPANIGPYSQARRCALSGRVYTAGVIPLVPFSMEPVSHQDVRSQAVLALQSLVRIWRAVGVDCDEKEKVRGAVVYVTDAEAANVAVNVWRRWRGEGEEGRKVVAVEVNELPRGVRVEWEGLVGEGGVKVEFGDVKAKAGEVVYGGDGREGDGVRAVLSRGVWDWDGKRWARVVMGWDESSA